MVNVIRKTEEEKFSIILLLMLISPCIDMKGTKKHSSQVLSIKYIFRYLPPPPSTIDTFMGPDLGFEYRNENPSPLVDESEYQLDETLTTVSSM